MSVTQTGNEAGKKSDLIFIILSISALILSLYFAPRLLSSAGISFLALESGMNKLLSVIISAIVGFVFLMPSSFFKRSMELMKGARTEWRKTVKPTKDQVVKTTLMVFVIVVFAAFIIFVVDRVLITLYNGLLG